MFHNITNYLYPQQISESLKVDVERNFSRFSFFDHHPKQQKEIDQIFKMTISDSNGTLVSVSTLLEASTLDDEHLDLFKKLGFTQLSSNPEIGMILEHPSLPGWLIKKNYGFQKIEGHSKRILKVVKGSDFPFWMLPPQLMNFSDKSSISIQVPNDMINPLRVVMLRRGRKWIKQLGLNHVRAAKEYLYILPTVSSSKPLYKRSVVISRKENVLSSTDSLCQYAKLANLHPERLRQIASQIVLLIQKLKLTDSHISNFLFLDDDSDTVIVVDGEPIGGLADAGHSDMVKAVEAFDPCFYSLLGLKKLQESISEQMSLDEIELKDIKKVQKIFDEVISSAITNIIQERAWQIVKDRIYTPSLIYNIIFIFQSFLTLFCNQNLLKHKENNHFYK